VVIRGKRELLARTFYRGGALSFLGLLPARDMLLVLNYHRVGNAEEDLFDPRVFSATGDELHEQISYLKRRFSLVTLEEALAFIEGKEASKKARCRILLTFDDGYLDNHKIAFPVLRAQGVQGVFFLATGIMGSSHVPWWDHIAYLLRTAQNRKFNLRYPADLGVNLDTEGLARSILNIVTLYERDDNTDPGRFLSELREAAKGSKLPETLRRFLNWEEAREMVEGGMAIGSHSHSHPVLSQLHADEQRQELSQSRALLREGLGVAVETLAYPFGGPRTYSDVTQRVAREAGYAASFCFHGGTNLAGATRRYAVNRVGVGDQSWHRFRLQTAVCRVSARFWP